MASDLFAEGGDILKNVFGDKELALLDSKYPELREAFEHIQKNPPSKHDFPPDAPSATPPDQPRGVPEFKDIIGWGAEKVVRILLTVLRDKPNVDPENVYQDAYNLLDDTLKKKIDRFLDPDGQSVEDLFTSSEGFNLPTSQASTEKFLKLDKAVKGSTDGARGINGDADFEVTAAQDDKFTNWGETVENTPKVTWAAPKKISELCNIVQKAKASGQRVRAAGYRHSWSNIFSENGQVLVSMLDQHLVETLPNCTSLELTPNYDGNDFKVIEVTGENPDNPGKALVKVGAAVTNEDFRRWAVKNNMWTIPINVIMVEITFGGSNAPICHGSGIQSKTLSDLVREIEYVDLNGKVRQISDRELLKAAAGCFGLLGIVTSLTLEVNKMTYAELNPKYKELLLAIPPPPNFEVPQDLQARYKELQDKPGVLEDALEEFKNTATKCYYAEWFWFPTQKNAFINAWNTTTDESGVIDYPSKVQTFAQWLSSWAGEVIQNSWFKNHQKLFTPHIQAEIMSFMAMKTLPKDKVKTHLINALHFRRGIQNMRVGDFEVEIPIPPTTVGGDLRDWRAVQQAWWDGITAMKQDKNYSARIALELRVTGDSEMLLAPQHGNRLGTASIEVITSMSAVDDPKKIWPNFKQTLANKWLALTGPDGKKLNVRPHFAKEWRGTLVDGKDWVTHLKETSMKTEIEDFKKTLSQIGENLPDGEKWTLKELQATFSTPLLDELIFA